MIVGRSVFASFSPELKLLYRHIAEGEEDFLQPRNQLLAAQARMKRPPALGDNSHIKAPALLNSSRSFATQLTII